MKTKPKETKSTALVIQQVQLSKAQQALIQTSTPIEFIKTRPIRGGKEAKYVEVGYVVAQLNSVFGPPNWQFEIVKEGETTRKLDKNSEGEVWCLGRLTILDHKNGYKVFKEQYGQHPIHASVPLGDAKKAAASDSLKKCASAFGIALDVYWQQLDEPAPEKESKPAKKQTEKELYEKAKVNIQNMQNVAALIETHERLKTSKYTEAHKQELMELATERVRQLEAEQ